MNKPYIYESKNNSRFSISEGIILLPDIYMQTDYSKRTVEEFSQAFGRPVFLLDYFYLSTQEANVMTDADRDKAHDLMVNFSGDGFVTFFNQVLKEIKEAHPRLNNFSVIGFCFGGRLAYIAGAHPDISRVVSFYGGGANTSNYVSGKTPVEYLAEKKGKNVSVTSFFGTNDPSIPLEDREKIKNAFTQAGGDFQVYEYEAGHAYFQEGRKNFNEAASRASWDVLKQIFNGH